MTHAADKPAAPRATALVLSVKAPGVLLYGACTAFSRHAGIFVPMPQLKRKPYLPRDLMCLLTGLMNDPNRNPMVGPVGRMVPRGAQRNKRRGVAVNVKSSGEGARDICPRIDAPLAGRRNSAYPTPKL